MLIVPYLANVTHSLGPQAESKEEAVAFEMQAGIGNTPSRVPNAANQGASNIKFSLLGL